jgi:hypothetical protein
MPVPSSVLTKSAGSTWDLFRRVHEIRERRQIAHAHQIRPAIGADDIRLFAEHPRVRGKPCPGQQMSVT